MPEFARVKRMSGLLDEKVLARLRGDDGGYSSSGSEHEADPALLDGFFPDDEPYDSPAVEEEEEEEEGGRQGLRKPFPAAAMVRDLMRPPAGQRFRADLSADVTEAAERLESLRPDGPAFRRAVMGALRSSGYDAGVCKSRWDAAAGVTAGSHEYIDVAAAAGEGTERYIVELDFAAEFEIARPAAEYGRMVAELPRAYVGTAEELRRAVRVLAEAAKRSMRAEGMHVPPWRKLRYLQAKWLGPYRRTTNPVPAGSSADAAAGALPVTSATGLRAGRSWDVQCRAVGFEPARVAVAPVGRTQS